MRQVEIQSVGGFEVGIELTVKAYVGGWQVAEVPSHWHDRSAGESKFELRNWLPQYLRWYFIARSGGSVGDTVGATLKRSRVRSWSGSGRGEPSRQLKSVGLYEMDALVPVVVRRRQ